MSCMRLLFGLSVLMLFTRASAQTCAVGQVLVNSVCTYNDPALRVWFKFESPKPKQNFGSWSFNYQVTSVTEFVTSSDAKEGSKSVILQNQFNAGGNSLSWDPGILTTYFWIFLDGVSNP